MGVFEGKYLNDCLLEPPREWYAGALRAGWLSPGAPNPRLNAFGVKTRLSLREWRKGWVLGDQNARGWFQWYCRYWLGRRVPGPDGVQVARWRTFVRHRAQILASYRRGRHSRMAAQKKRRRLRQRQALLQWAYDPYVCSG